MGDLGGQKQIRSIWSHYFKDTDAIIFVIDSNEPQRIDELKGDNAKDELHKLLKHKLLKDAIILIFANKMDLPHSININEITERLQLNEFSDRTWFIQETCQCQATEYGKDSIGYLQLLNTRENGKKYEIHSKNIINCKNNKYHYGICANRFCARIQ